MATAAKKPTPAQLAARKRFAAAAKAGTLKAGAKLAKPTVRKTVKKRMSNPRDPNIPGDFSQSSPNVFGRAWNEAKTAKMKEYSDGETTVRLTWPDGEWLQMIYDTKAGALHNLKKLGFVAK